MSGAAGLPTAPLSAALFDLDGTLLDTAPDLARALNALRAERQLPALPLGQIRLHVSHGTNAVVRAGFPQAGAAAFDALRDRFLELYRGAIAVETRLFDGFATVLERLEAHGVPWGVVTNKAAALTEPLLQAMGLAARAGCIISGDTLPQRKPDPLPLRTAAQRLGVPAARCLYLGDALRDAQAAQAAGMVGLGARYGYVDPRDVLEEWPVTAWIDEPLELLEWLGLPRASQ